MGRRGEKSGCLTHHRAVETAEEYGSMGVDVFDRLEIMMRRFEASGTNRVFCRQRPEPFLISKLEWTTRYQDYQVVVLHRKFYKTQFH